MRGIYLTELTEKSRRKAFMFRKIILLTVGALSLCQCNTLRSDCEAIAKREAEIAQEQPGNYFIGRRYYIPYTRFWGYLREPGQSWRTAKLVIMDEKQCRQPDRGPERPLPGAVFGTDHNVEYIIRGSYTNEEAYEPNTNQPLPVFRLTGFEVKNRKPGFLFYPSERYSDKMLTLQPKFMPTPERCATCR